MSGYTFATFQYGGQPTAGFGINDSGVVAGSFGTNAASEGFTYSQNNYTLVNYPGANTSTQLSGISTSGELIGFVSGSSSAQAFTDTAGVFSVIESPAAAQYVNGFAINRAGTEILGGYIQGQDIFSFAKNGSQTTVLTYPGYGTAMAASNQTLATGVNSAGEIVGSYGVTGGTFHGFTYVAGTFASVDFAGATTTHVNGINDSGELVGSYTTVGGTQHGFVDLGGVFTTVDVPTASATIINGVNSSGEIVGTATFSNGSEEAFTATPVLCFVTGTRIRLARANGEVDVSVENLRVGDLAVTATGTIRPIRWIGNRIIRLDTRAVPSEAWPIRILAGAFGGNLPGRELRLSPGHPVLVGAGEGALGGVLVPIMSLINGTSIARVPVETVTYWHVELDAHDLLLAEGLPAESFLDLGNRPFFDGSDDHLHDADHVDAGQGWRCRPVAVEGLGVETERRRLDAIFAMSLEMHCAWPESTSHPAVDLF